MCFLVLGYLKNGNFICGFNRDEYYARKWTPTYFQKNKNYLGGKDSKSGGTWLAISDNLNFLAVTNVRLSDTKKMMEVKNSRGLLADRFFSSQLSSYAWLESISKERDPNYYNLIAGSILEKEFYYASCVNDHFHIEMIDAPWCMSNSGPGEKWEKVQRGEELFSQKILDNVDYHKAIHELLKDLTQSKKIPDTGYSAEIEYLL